MIYTLEDAERMCKEKQEELMAQHPDWTKADRAVHQTLHATIYRLLPYKIIGISQHTVDIEDEQGNRSDVFQQGDGKWKCLRCQRLTCDHAMFVKAQNPEMPKQVIGLADDILTY
jgi:hypothetical protein